MVPQLHAAISFDTAFPLMTNSGGLLFQSVVEGRKTVTKAIDPQHPDTNLVVFI